MRNYVTLKQFNSLVLHSVFENADVAKLADVLDLGSSAERHGGSSPPFRTETPSLSITYIT
jgi:hypothetical protein